LQDHRWSEPLFCKITAALAEPRKLLGGDLPAPAAWRKSTFSNSQAACVEVADLPTGAAVRDSKDPGGPVLRLTGAVWAAFTTAVAADEFC
jgi:hypothetical protein